MHHIKKVYSFTVKTLLFSLLFLTLFLIAIAGFIARRELTIKDAIYPHVYINGIDFSNKAKSDVVTYFQRKNKELSESVVLIRYADTEATYSAQTIKLGFDVQTAAEQATLIGRSGPILSRNYQRIVSILGLDRFDLTASLTYDITPIKEHLDDLQSQYNRDPENALFQFENGRVTAFKIERNGLQVKTDEALATINTELQNLPFRTGKRIIVRVGDVLIKPQITLASINDQGIEEKIGEGRSDYTGSIPGRVHNLILATSRINGVIVKKDQVFSFNQTVGDISADTGYEQAYIIKNGQTVLGDGGGVCQVSTTLFRAAMDAGLPIIERNAHAYRVHYYENDRKPGFDATVFAPHVDFKFKNDTSGALLIQTEVDKKTRTLTYTFYGKKDGRVVTISNATIWDIQPAPPARFQDDPTLKVGVTKQVDWAAPGTKSKFHYRVERNGELLQDRDFFSNFRPWQAAYLVGTGQ